MTEDYSVHRQETSAGSSEFGTYQAYQRTFCPEEWRAAEQLYSSLPLETRVPYSEQLNDCRTSSWFLRQIETGEVRIASNTCRLRWCPLCSRARQNYIAWQVREWVEIASYPKFVTFTLKHTDAPLKEQVTALYRFFRKVRNHNSLVKTCRGGIWFFHIKRDETDSRWHPHIHCVVEGAWIPQRQLSQAWKRITSTSKIVDIRPVRDPRKAVSDIARYCSRPANLRDVTPSLRKELWWAMHGRKLCGTWGSAKKVSLKQPGATERWKWEKIGRWSVVTSQLKLSSSARDIINAWRLGKELPAGIHLLEGEELKQYQFVRRDGEFEPKHQTNYEQMYLF